MKRIALAIMCLMPLAAVAQDNTWERINQEETESEHVNPDQKYLVGAVPVVNGKVEFSTVIKAPGKSKKEIYQVALKYMTKMTKEPNQPCGDRQRGERRGLRRISGMACLQEYDTCSRPHTILL